MALLERSWGPPSAHLAVLGCPSGVNLAILTLKFSIISQLSIRFGPKLLSKLNFERFGIDLGLSRTLKIELPCRRELNFHVFQSWAFNRAFWFNLERFGRFLGSTWSLLGSTWALLWPTCGQLGRSRGQLVTNLSALWVILDALESILGALGALLGTLERLWTLQERSWLDFGAPEEDFGASQRGFRRLRSSILGCLAIVSGI